MPSTQKHYTCCLSDYGLADEEVIQELAFHDAAFAGRFLEKTLAAGVRFTTEQVLRRRLRQLPDCYGRCY